MNRSAPFTLASLLLLSACGSCDEQSDPQPEASERTVANAEPSASAMEMRTEDGLQVVQASPQMRQRQERLEQARQEALEDLILEPTSPDPEGGEFTLEEAVVGLGTDGTLVAEIRTGLGTLICDLYAEKAPNTVANFIGLARGNRPWWDARAGVWRETPYYRDQSFHRVIPGFLAQAGDYLDGADGPIGYTIPDEPHEDLRHDRAGQLCMASKGPDDNAAQFFVTDAAAPQLDADGQFTIFGQCRNTDVVYRIARVPQGEENRPRTRVLLDRVLVRRVVGGAEEAGATPPTMPEGFDPLQTPFGAHGPGGSMVPQRFRWPSGMDGDTAPRPAD